MFPIDMCKHDHLEAIRQEDATVVPQPACVSEMTMPIYYKFHNVISAASKMKLFPSFKLFSPKAFLSLSLSLSSFHLLLS